MRNLWCLALLGVVELASSRSSQAQTTCSPTTLSEAAASVSAVRHRLHRLSVGELDPKVPADIAAQLAHLKEGLARAADAAFACAETSVGPEDLENKLAEALEANLSEMSGTMIVTRNKRDLGAYGSDLAVQVLPMNTSPKFFEVNFRYGIECGDDNLLLVFEAGHQSGLPGSTGEGWHERLRWSASGYTTVGDAFGDFVLLTPLSGARGVRNWRFVVAHGQPSCAIAGAPSQFDLDVLSPSDKPAQPRVVWHLEKPYTRSNTQPRLATTEETVEFQVPDGSTASAKTAKGPPPVLTYRYRIGEDNTVQDLGSGSNTPAP